MFCMDLKIYGFFCHCQIYFYFSMFMNKPDKSLLKSFPLVGYLFSVCIISLNNHMRKSSCKYPYSLDMESLRLLRITNFLYISENELLMWSLFSSYFNLIINNSILSSLLSLTRFQVPLFNVLNYCSYRVPIFFCGFLLILYAT
jgi:hypothetical protein